MNCFAERLTLKSVVMLFAPIMQFCVSNNNKSVHKENLVVRDRTWNSN